MESDRKGLWKRVLMGVFAVVGVLLIIKIFNAPYERNYEQGSIIYEGPESHGGWMWDECVEGVLYSKNMASLPMAAVLDQKGQARRCSDGKRELKDFRARYHLICRDGVEYVRMREHRQYTLFVRYDAASLLPRQCES